MIGEKRGMKGRGRGGVGADEGIKSVFCVASEAHFLSAAERSGESKVSLLSPLLFLSPLHFQALFSPSLPPSLPPAARFIVAAAVEGGRGGAC